MQLECDSLILEFAYTRPHSSVLLRNPHLAPEEVISRPADPTRELLNIWLNGSRHPIQLRYHGGNSAVNTSHYRVDLNHLSGTEGCIGVHLVVLALWGRSRLARVECTDSRLEVIYEKSVCIKLIFNKY